MRPFSHRGPNLTSIVDDTVLSTILLLFMTAAPAPASASGPTRDTLNIIEPKENYIYELEHWKAKEALDSLLQPPPDAIRQVSTFPDSTWKDLEEYQSETPQGTWWAATSIAIADSAPADRYFALLPDRIVSAFDLFWDGVYVASNGTVSLSLLGETPGKYFTVIQIPSPLTHRGIHSVALRISNWHMRSRWEHGQFFFGYYDSIIRLIFAWQIRIYFLLDVVFLALLLTNSRVPYVLARDGDLPAGLATVHRRA